MECARACDVTDVTEKVSGARDNWSMLTYVIRFHADSIAADDGFVWTSAHIHLDRF